jgi:hypothetical protein
MLMINNHIARFQLPGKLLKTKKCAPSFRGNMDFPIYLFFQCYNVGKKNKNDSFLDL